MCFKKINAALGPQVYKHITLPTFIAKTVAYFIAKLIIIGSLNFKYYRD